VNEPLTPEDKIDHAEMMLRLQAMQEIQHVRLLALGAAIDDVVKTSGAKMPSGFSTSPFVKRETLRYLREKYSKYPDAGVAYWVKHLLDEYEKS
jgi:hypothetical protein